MKERFKILLLLLFPILAFGKNGDSEFKKTIVKEFPANSGTTLNVSNKYGKIVVHTWNRNEVKAIVVITGFGKNMEEAESITRMVDIGIETPGNDINLKTNYNTSSGNKWFSWGNRKNSKDYVNIDYELFVPEKFGKLMLENNFGDIITDVLTFPAELRLNYCSYDIKGAQKPLDINMNYCDRGRIGKADVVTIRANYSNVKSDVINSLTTRSNYSDFTIGTVTNLSVSANYDDYIVTKVGSVTAKCNYTDFRITELQTTANAHMVYGDFSAKILANTFKGADMHLTYSDLKMGVPLRLAVQIRVQLTSGSVRTGELTMKTVSNIKKNSQLSYTAITTTGDEQSPLINVRGVYSDVNLSSN